MLTHDQLVRVFANIKPQNVDVTPSPDMRTIEGIRAGWRWEIPCPSDEFLELEWNKIKDQVNYEKRESEYNKRGVTTDKMIVALWEKIMENSDASASSLQSIREQVKTEMPKPVK